MKSFPFLSLVMKKRAIRSSPPKNLSRKFSLTHQSIQRIRVLLQKCNGCPFDTVFNVVHNFIKISSVRPNSPGNLTRLFKLLNSFVQAGTNMALLLARSPQGMVPFLRPHKLVINSEPYAKSYSNPQISLDWLSDSPPESRFQLFFVQVVPFRLNPNSLRIRLIFLSTSCPKFVFCNCFCFQNQYLEIG